MRPARALRALVCVNPFKGTLSAAEAAASIARGLRGAGWSVETLPLADGGPGTLAAMKAASGGSLRRVLVPGPLGAPVRAAWLLLSPREALIEGAQANGLHLCPQGRRDPMAASSRGLGRLLLQAKRAGALTAWVGLGGSATTDGGTGLARALGWRFLDASGRELPDGGGPLEALARVVAPAKNPLGALRVRVLCDVDNPLYGPRGAAAVYGPQKGAGPGQVRRLDRGLRRLAACVAAAGRARGAAGRPGPWTPGAGAAGGLGFGLLAFARAELAGGAARLLELSSFASRAEGADWVVTGEGRLDSQSLRGKLPWAVAQAARAAGRPCAAFCGRCSLQARAWRRAGFADVLAAPGAAPRGAAAALQRAARAWGQRAMDARPKIA